MVGQRADAQRGIGEVDSLPGTQGPRRRAKAHQLVGSLLDDLEPDLTVIDQNTMTDVHLVHHLVVGRADPAVRARDGLPLDRQPVAGGHGHLPVPDRVETDLGAAQIAENRGPASRLADRAAQALEHGRVAVEGSMREIQAKNVDALGAQPSLCVEIRARRSQGRDSLGSHTIPQVVRHGRILPTRC